MRDGKLFGRGSADTKGFLAAVLPPRRRARPGAAPRSALLFTADEEVGLPGGQAALAEGRIRPRHAIIGEPTSLVPVRAHKGYCAVDVEVTGVEGHSAFPDVGRLGHPRGGAALAEIERIGAGSPPSTPTRSSTPPYTTLNVGIIRGGKARNIIAGECRFTLEWRPLPGPAAREGARAAGGRLPGALEEAGGGQLRSPARRCASTRPP